MGHFHTLFRLLDTSSVGKLSRVEWIEAATAMDGKKDGSVSRREWAAMGAPTEVFDFAKKGKFVDLARECRRSR